MQHASHSTRSLSFHHISIFQRIGRADEQFEANTDLKQFQETTQIIEKEQASTEETHRSRQLVLWHQWTWVIHPLGLGGSSPIFTVFETKELNAEVRVSSRRSSVCLCSIAWMFATSRPPRRKKRSKHSLKLNIFRTSMFPSI